MGAAVIDLVPLQRSHQQVIETLSTAHTQRCVNSQSECQNGYSMCLKNAELKHVLCISRCCRNFCIQNLSYKHRERDTSHYVKRYSLNH